MGRRRSRRIGRAAAIALLAALVLVVGLHFAVRQVSWFGPWLANSLRAVVGADAVTYLEELAAELEDGYQRVVRVRVPPRTLEQARPALSVDAARAPGLTPRPASAPAVAPAPSSAVPFRPVDVAPMDRRVAAKGDGQWQAVSDPFRPNAPPLLFATLLHPDAKRPWAEVFVVAVAVAEIRLHAVAGTLEPEATTPSGRSFARGGLIPQEAQAQLLAAFNGGFMTRHGRHGMHVAGVTLVSPRAHLCTLLGLRDGSLRIGTWQALEREVERAEREAQLDFWRQAAPCMYERGALNAQLRDEKVRNWGATIDGDVVIRRSAVGLDAAGKVLFVAISNDTTARAMATAVHHAGASDVAQLDVNWSYPKFLVFPSDASGRRHAQGVFEGFVCHADEYVRRASTRDFFYLVRRELPAESRAGP